MHMWQGAPDKPTVHSWLLKGSAAFNMAITRCTPCQRQHQSAVVCLPKARENRPSGLLHAAGWSVPTQLGQQDGQLAELAAVLRQAERCRPPPPSPPQPAALRQDSNRRTWAMWTAAPALTARRRPGLQQEQQQQRRRLVAMVLAGTHGTHCSRAGPLAAVASPAEKQEVCSCLIFAVCMHEHTQVLELPGRFGQPDGPAVPYSSLLLLVGCRLEALAQKIQRQQE